MAKRLSAQLEDEGFRRGRVAAQSAEARDKFKKHNEEQTIAPPSPIFEMARIKVLHVHDKFKRVAIDLRQIEEEVIPCQKHHEVSLPAIPTCDLARAHGDNVIDELLNKMTSIMETIVKEMQKFHSNHRNDAEQCSRYDIASPVEINLLSNFESAARPPDIQLPPPVQPGAYARAAQTPSFMKQMQ